VGLQQPFPETSTTYVIRLFDEAALQGASLGKETGGLAVPDRSSFFEPVLQTTA